MLDLPTPSLEVLRREADAALAAGQAGRFEVEAHLREWGTINGTPVNHWAAIRDGDYLPILLTRAGMGGLHAIGRVLSRALSDERPGDMKLRLFLVTPPAAVGETASVAPVRGATSDALGVLAGVPHLAALLSDFGRRLG